MGQRGVLMGPRGIQVGPQGGPAGPPGSPMGMSDGPPGPPVRPVGLRPDRLTAGVAGTDRPLESGQAPGAHMVSSRPWPVIIFDRQRRRSPRQDTFSSFTSRVDSLKATAYPL